MNRGALALRAILKLISGFAILGGLIFGAAGTIHFTRGWMLLAALGIPMLALGLVVLLRSPEVLARRIEAGESRPEQKRVVALMGWLIVASLALSGFNVRLGWPGLPLWASVAALIVFEIGYGLYAAVMRQNAYATRTVRVEVGQKLMDTGLYGLVRHPMYTSVCLISPTMPLILGSWIAFLPMLALPVLLARRIKNEEALLEQDLPGYRAYKRRVKYRMIPFVW